MERFLARWFWDGCIIDGCEAECSSTSSCCVCTMPVALAVPVLCAYPSGNSVLCVFYHICSALKIRFEYILIQQILTVSLELHFHLNLHDFQGKIRGFRSVILLYFSFLFQSANYYEKFKDVFMFSLILKLSFIF